ncbi:MAG: hypothetical protein V7643_1587 [Mycobacterium sp.]|jgi:hypothetical protein
MDHPTELDVLLRDWGGEVRARQPTINVGRVLESEPRTRRHLRRGTIVGSATLVAITSALAAVVTVVVHTGGGTPEAQTLVSDGSVVSGSGIVFAEPGKPTRFCPVGVDPQVATPSGGAPSHACSVSVEITGVELSTLSSVSTYGNTTIGYANLVGVYSLGHLRVTGQSAYHLARPAVLTSVPCAAPAGGWPTGGTDENLNLAAAEQYADSHPGSIVSVVMARRSGTQVVAYVITSGDPAPTRAALKAAYGNRLCVARSEYRVRDLHSAYARFSQLASQPPSVMSVVGVAQVISAHGQPEIAVRVNIESRRVAALAGSYPAGMVRVTPWLRTV